MAIPISAEFVEKYNKPGPRYTSYPTVPAWDRPFGHDEYVAALEEQIVVKEREHEDQIEQLEGIEEALATSGAEGAALTERIASLGVRILTTAPAFAPVPAVKELTAAGVVVGRVHRFDRRVHARSDPAGRPGV